jgi:phage-related protein
VRDLEAILKEHMGQLRDELPWIWLYEIQTPEDPPRRYRLTNNTKDIQFGQDSAGTPLVYSAFPISHAEITQESKGSLPRFTVSIGNATAEISRAIDDWRGLVGQRAVIRLVNVEALDIQAAQIRFDAQVLRATSAREVVEFELGPFNISEAKFPRWRFTSVSCRLRFGEPRCGYIVPGSPGNTVGTGFDFCPKTLTGCEERGADEEARNAVVLHPEKFGGFLGIPKR